MSSRSDTRVDPQTAREDLAFLRAVLERTQRRVDPHAFHFVSWGAIVLVWYPLNNLIEMRETPGPWGLVLGVTSLLVGVAIGWIGEVRLNRKLARGELPPEDPEVGRQVVQVVWGALAPAIVLSSVGPATGLVPGPSIPLVWGFAYAVLAWGMGVVYSAEFRWGAVFIFAGCLAALAAPAYAGIVLGLTMGPGILVPGLIAMRRVRAQRESAVRTGADGGA